MRPNYLYFMMLPIGIQVLHIGEILFMASWARKVLIAEGEIPESHN
jgi:hypothetical protein